MERIVRPTELDRSLDLIYEAAADPSKWRSALEAFGRAGGAEGVLLQINPFAGRPTAIFTESLDHSMPTFIRDAWFLRNEPASRGLALATAQHGEAIATEATLYTPEDYMREPMHMDFLRPQGFGLFAGITVIDPHGIAVQISLQRRWFDEPYSRQEVGQLAAVLPHLRRAIRMACALGLERARGSMDVFEQLGVAALMIDTGGRVCRVNHYAEALLGDSLTVSAGHLTSRTPAIAAGLRAMVGGLVASDHASPHLGPLQVPRRVGRPLVVHGSPLIGSARNHFGSAAAIIVIVDPDAGTPHAELWLRRAFGFTAAEAETAALIADGLDLRTIAAKRGVGHETVRSNVASIADKTDARTRGEQVALFSRLLLRAPQPG